MSGLRIHRELAQKRAPTIPLAMLAVALASNGCVGGSQHSVGAARSDPKVSDLRAPDASTPIHERDAEIPASGLTLKGTLEIPAGRTGHRFAAVFFGAGSGPESRDEVLTGQLNMQFGCAIHVFRDVAAGLSRRGYASLRFDARNCGPFNGCADNGYPPPATSDTVATELADLQAAAIWLKAQPEVDPSRVFYVGHSEGASFAPELLAEDPSLKAAVMLAAGFHPIDEILGIQERESEVLVSQVGAPEAQVDAALAQLRAAIAELDALRAGTFSGSNILGTSTAYWKSWLQMTDDAPTLAAWTKRPLLVMSGDYDRNVPPSELSAWQLLFTATDDASVAHTTALLPCVTHALNCIDQPDITKIRVSDIGCSVDEQVTQKIADFLDSSR
jgi:dienelactone hydrolase